MVAHIRDMAVQKRRWLDDETFRNGVALCQTIPGATAMQTSAYVGLRVHGVRGAAASFIGFGLPGFLLMLAFSVLYAQFHGLPAVVSAFGGLHALIVALIAHAAFTFGRAYLKKWQDFLIVPVAAVLFWIGLSPILVVAPHSSWELPFGSEKTALLMRHRPNAYSSRSRPSFSS